MKTIAEFLKKIIGCGEAELHTILEDFRKVNTKLDNLVVAQTKKAEKAITEIVKQTDIRDIANKKAEDAATVSAKIKALITP